MLVFQCNQLYTILKYLGCLGILQLVAVSQGQLSPPTQDKIWWLQRHPDSHLHISSYGILFQLCPLGKDSI